VLEAIGDVNYRVQRTGRSRKQVVHVDKMKKYIEQAPSPWEILGGGHDQPAEVDPTPPELTFDNSFFSQLPAMYNPDEDVAVPLVTTARQDDEEQFTVAPDFQGTTPPVTPERPRRVIVKPARFRWVRDASDEDSEWYQPTDELHKECNLPSDDENWYASDDEETITQLSTNPRGPEITTPDQPTPSYAINRADNIFEMSPDIEIDISSDEPTLELTIRF